MKRGLFIVVIFLFSLSIKANGLTLSVDRLKLPQVINLIYTEVLKRPYMLSPDLSNDTRLLTFSLDENVNVEDFIDRYFLNMNLKIWRKNGVDYISIYKEKPIQPILETFVYKPKFREVAYLSDVLSTQIKAVNKSEEMITSNNIDPNYAVNHINKAGDLLVFRGTKENIKLIKSVLPLIDVVADEIVITGYLVEVSDTEKSGNGLSIIANLFSNKLGIEINSGYTPSSGNVLTFKSNPFSIIAEIFDKESRFKVVSSPHLRVKNGASASFSVGSDVPVIGSTTYQDGKPVQSIEYKSSGVLFNITPYIRGNIIDLKLQQQLSNFIKTETGVDNSPTLIKRDINTDISIKDGEIIVLGGLAETKESQNATKLKLLPFLKSKGKENSKTDIVLILHAKKILK